MADHPDFEDTEYLARKAARKPAPAQRLLSTTTYQTGDQVEKFTGDYVAPGEVRVAFTTKAGKLRYVVEHTWPGGTGGFLHIYSEDNLRPVSAANEVGAANEIESLHDQLAEAAGAANQMGHLFERMKAERDALQSQLAEATGSANHLARQLEQTTELNAARDAALKARTGS